MTPLQFEHWKEFSLAMARGYPNVTEARRQKIVAEVEEFFWWREHRFDWPAFRSYDSTWPVFEPHWQRRDLLVLNQRACCVDTILSESYEEHIHVRYFPKSGDEKERGNKFHNQFKCCIRAGIDVAAEPRAGVLGFSIGDLKAWFGGTIPEWITRQYEDDLNTAPDSHGIWL